MTAVVVGGAGIAVGASLVRATSHPAKNVVVDFESGIGAWFVAWSQNDLTLAHSVMPASPGHRALALKLVGVLGSNPVGGNKPAAAMPAPESLHRGLPVTYQVWAPPEVPSSLTVTPYATQENPWDVRWGNGTTLHPGSNTVTFDWPLLSGSGTQIGLEVEGIPVGWSGTLYLDRISWPLWSE